MTLACQRRLEVALLHRRQRRVDDDQPDMLVRDRAAQRLDLAAAEQGAGRAAERARLGLDDLEVDRPRQADRLVQARLGARFAVVGAAARAADFAGRMDDEARLGRRLGPRCVGAGVSVGARPVAAAQSSPPSLPPSNSWIGCAGMTVEIACL